MKPRSGSYVLILENHTYAGVEVGRWGGLEIEPGYYLYIGSAFGPGGVRARVSRHLRKGKPKHWHIDYLREYMVPVSVWICYDPGRLEHRWATSLAGMSGMKPVNGFGCTDCRCSSHLFFTTAGPDFDCFATIAAGSMESWVCRGGADGKPVPGIC